MILNFSWQGNPASTIGYTIVCRVGVPPTKLKIISETCLKIALSLSVQKALILLDPGKNAMTEQCQAVRVEKIRRTLILLCFFDLVSVMCHLPKLGNGKVLVKFW